VKQLVPISKARKIRKTSSSNVRIKNAKSFIRISTKHFRERNLLLCSKSISHGAMILHGTVYE